MKATTLLVLLAFPLFLCFLFVIPKEQALPTPDSPISLYETRSDNLKSLIISAVREAEKSVLLIIYSLRDRDVIQALRKKAEQGMDVTVICDAKASKGVSGLLGKKVRLVSRYSGGLMHQKILVIDQSRIWIGSANLIFLPIANKLKFRSQEEVLLRQVMIEGVLSISQGDNPRIVEEKLKAYLPPKYKQMTIEGGGASASREEPAAAK